MGLTVMAPKLQLTDGLIEQIADQVKAGVPARYAASSLGIAETTFHRWMAIGRGGWRTRQPVSRTLRSRAERLVAELEKADAHAVRRRVLTVETAVRQGDWRASAWALERTKPHEFGQRSQVEVRAIASLEDELRELLGHNEAEVQITAARERVRRVLDARTLAQTRDTAKPGALTQGDPTEAQ